MESYQGSRERPDFYEEFGMGQSPVTLDTTDRLFKIAEPGWGRPSDRVSIQLSDESVPEELRGVSLTLGRPKGRGPAGPGRLSMMGRDGEFGGQLTELLASRVADYIEAERAKIRESEQEGESSGEKYVRQQRELDAFLARIRPTPLT